ncbi:beta galactosidase [Emiliania huxleyi CCMP1516]|uniref:Beta-galactosidase n=2 Tax=Emiliania huxleyi TaxID=2903 RepID=A0A0D3KI59_EMIH1|nr:beta galactosidase [Emiliania huxleyi CCMP1516]EOD35444.1 beta galactosidase [Emiliania huxleyi CCMP1516]|eukprot:XP_005787873.1 beta galactosidase [Emiliania huxleyi CCMP1516]
MDLGALFGGSSAPARLLIERDQFVLDGQNFTVRAGCVHYFRVHPDLWEDRLARIAALGLNAVQTYVPWNYHQAWNASSLGPARVDLDSPSRDLPRFLRLAHGLGLRVVLRPGPYVCGEFEFGGLPAWLLRDGPIELRTDAEPYMGHVERWWGELLPRLRREGLMLDDGGPVMLVQIENEYGHFGDVSEVEADRRYLERLADLARRHLGTPPPRLPRSPAAPRTRLRDTSMAWPHALPPPSRRRSSQVLTTVDSCDVPEDAWAAQRSFNPPGRSPFFCSELWVGWFAHWGEPARPNLAAQRARDVAERLRRVLAVNGGTGSVSLYMAHGGTSFGWWAGANTADGMYLPDTPSYDYGAPIGEGGGHGLDEAGGDKYAALQSVLLEAPSGGGSSVPSSSPSASRPPPPPAEPQPLREEPPPPRRLSSTVEVELPEAVRLMEAETLAALSGGGRCCDELPLPMEEVGCDYGIVVYETELPAGGGGPLQVSRLRDRLLAFVDGEFVGRMYRQQGWGRADPKGLLMPPPRPYPRTLRLLVENLGRVGFVDLPWFSRTFLLDQRKGILGGVWLNGTLLNRTGPDGQAGWRTHCLPFDDAQLDVLRRLPARQPSGLLDTAGSVALGAGSVALDAGSVAVSVAGAMLHLAQGSDRDSPPSLPSLLPSSQPPSAATATFYRGAFELPSADAGADAWLALGGGWAHGTAWVNGWHLGRYWLPEGPQRSLYVPGPLLREGGNELLLLSLDVAEAEADGQPRWARLYPSPNHTGARSAPQETAAASSRQLQIYSYAAAYSATKLTSANARHAVVDAFSHLEGLLSLGSKIIRLRAPAEPAAQRPSAAPIVAAIAAAGALLALVAAAYVFRAGRLRRPWRRRDRALARRFFLV